MRYLLALSLAAIACNGALKSAPLAATDPAPTAVTPEPPPPYGPPSPDPPYDVVQSPPAPSSVPDCSPDSVGICILDHFEGTGSGETLNEAGVTGAFGQALSQTSFYWMDTNFTIQRVPKSGGKRSIVLDAEGVGIFTATAIATNADTLFWARQGTLHRRPESATPPTSLPFGSSTSSSASVLAVDARDAFIADTRGLLRVPFDGSAVETLPKLECLQLALDDDHVYCRSFHGLARMRRDTKLLTALSAATGVNMVIHEGSLYIDDLQKNVVVKLPKDGGPTTTFFMPEPRDIGSIGSIAVAGGALYVTQNGTTPESGTTIRRTLLDANTTTTLTLENGFRIYSKILADATGVYWLDMRATCLKEHVVPNLPGFEPQRECLEALREIRIVRAPLVF